MRLSLRLFDALLNLTQAKLSTGISLLGIILGITSLGSLLELSAVANTNYQQALTALGVQQAHVLMTPLRDAKQMSAETRQHQWLQLMTAVSKTALVPYSHQQDQSTAVLGIPPETISLWPLQIRAGRALTALDRYSNVVMLGHQHPQAQASQLEIYGRKFTVVAVFEAEPLPILGIDLNRAALLHWARPATLGWPVTVDMAWLRGDTAGVKGYLSLYFPNHHFFIRDTADFLNAFTQQVSHIQQLLGYIAIITLTLGGLSIFNLRLITVQQRMHEVGVRLAVGARALDIAGLFILEAVYLGSVGGVLGVLLAKVLCWSVAVHLNWTYSPLTLISIVPFCASILLSTLAGLYPAIQAARLKPSFLLTSQ